jgi:hypothetical protein
MEAGKGAPRAESAARREMEQEMTGVEGRVKQGGSSGRTRGTSEQSTALEHTRPGNSPRNCAQERGDGREVREREEAGMERASTGRNRAAEERARMEKPARRR